MTPHDLIAAFDAVAEAPGGMERLRELVLRLAVRGRLVSQDLADEPANVLLERIAAEKARLVKNGTIRVPTPLPAVSAEAATFDAPEGWAWCRFQDLHRKLGAGSTPLGGKRAYVQDGAIFIRSQNVWNDGLRLKDAARISASTHTRMAETTVLPDDVLLNITGASIGRSAVVPSGVGAANVSQHVAILRQVEPATRSWVHLFVISPIGYACIMGAQVGISREGLSMNRLREFPIPVPPLAEQHRIVARVNELMGLLDRLEAAGMTRDTTRAAVRDSTLDALREANASDEVEVAWNRVAERMDELLCDPADIAPLRQAVLQLAVRGRLVSQDLADEPANVLLERIAAEKARLVKAGTIPSQQPFPPVSRDDVPFDAPEGWAWCRMDDCFAVAGGIQKSGKRRPVSNSFPYLRVANVQRSTLDLRAIAKFELFNGELERLRLRRGDLLVVEGNGSETEIGRCARWDGEIDDCVHQNHIIRCRPLANGHEQFVLRFLNSPTGMDIMKELAVTTSGLYTLSVGKVRSITMPVPPLAEQHRIVARVDESMGLLDRLETRLTAARTAHGAFAAAAVHHLDA